MRPIRLPQTFVFWFIAPDDKAIGEHKQYGEYVKSGDESVLGLKPEVPPSYYFLRPLNDDLGDDIRSALDGSEDKSAAQEIVMEALTTRLIRETLCGCVNHPMLVGQNKNKPIVNRVEWKIGEAAPEGLVENVLEDKVLCTIIFNFLLSRMVLTEEEKN